MVMPKTDYTDPEIQFPRLQARVHKTDDDAFYMQIWIWDKPGDGRGGERREILNGKRASSYADITEMIYACARERGVDVGPDDITIDERGIRHDFQHSPSVLARINASSGSANLQGLILDADQLHAE
jgi:hypothetical protein